MAAPLSEKVVCDWIAKACALETDGSTIEFVILTVPSQDKRGSWKEETRVMCATLSVEDAAAKVWAFCEDIIESAAAMGAAACVIRPVIQRSTADGKGTRPGGTRVFRTSVAPHATGDDGDNATDERGETVAMMREMRFMLRDVVNANVAMSRQGYDLALEAVRGEKAAIEARNESDLALAASMNDGEEGWKKEIAVEITGGLRQIALAREMTRLDKERKKAGLPPILEQMATMGAMEAAARQTKAGG